MPVIKTYFTAEEACIAAATLESSGIEATAIDHSSFDSSLLGSTSGVDTWAIEVAEGDVEKAQVLLTADSDSPEAGHRDTESAADRGLAEGPCPPLREVFRALLVAEIVVIAISVVFNSALYHDTPSEFDQFTISEVLSEGLWFVADDVANAFLLMCVLANVLLFQFVRLGRILYMANTAWWAITYLAYPPVMRTPFGELVNSLEWALAGAIIALMWLPPLSQQFRRKPGE